MSCYVCLIIKSQNGYKPAWPSAVRLRKTWWRHQMETFAQAGDLGRHRAHYDVIIMCNHEKHLKEYHTIMYTLFWPRVYSHVSQNFCNECTIIYDAFLSVTFKKHYSYTSRASTTNLTLKGGQASYSQQFYGHPQSLWLHAALTFLMLRMSNKQVKWFRHIQLIENCA